MAYQKGMKRHEVVEGLTQEQEGKKKNKKHEAKGRVFEIQLYSFCFLWQRRIYVTSSEIPICRY